MTPVRNLSAEAFCRQWRRRCCISHLMDSVWNNTLCRDKSVRAGGGRDSISQRHVTDVQVTNADDRRGLQAQQQQLANRLWEAQAASLMPTRRVSIDSWR